MRVADLADRSLDLQDEIAKLEALAQWRGRCTARVERVSGHESRQSRDHRESMIGKANHIAWAADAVGVFQKHCGTGDEHAIADLICDLGHLAEERGFDFLSEVRRGIGHWYAEHHASDRDHFGPDAKVEITVTPK